MNKSLARAALIDAIWETSNRNVLQLYLPYLEYALSKTARVGQRIDTLTISESMAKELSFVSFPQAILDRLLKRLCDEGKVSRERDGYYLRVSLSNVADEIERKRSEVTQNLQAVGDSLAAYMTNRQPLRRRHRRVQPVGMIDALDCLAEFFQLKGISLLVDPDELGTMPRHDIKERVAWVEDWLRELYTDPSKEAMFQRVLSTVKGFYVANAIHLQPEDVDILPLDLPAMTFYLDTGFLLDLLGYQSEEKKLSAEQLLEMMRGTHASIGYFEQTQHEIRDVLYAFQRAIIHDGGRNAYQNFDLVGFGPEPSPEYVRACEQTFAKTLEDRGIHLATDIPQITKEIYPIDQNDLAERLGVIRYRNRQALFNDVKSVDYVARMRGVARPYDLVECQELFITTNARFARITAQSTGTDRPNKPFPFVWSDVQLASVLWARQSNTEADLPAYQLIKSTQTFVNISEEERERFVAIASKYEHDSTFSPEVAALVSAGGFDRRDYKSLISDNPDGVTNESVAELIRLTEQKLATKERRDADQARRERDAALLSAEEAHGRADAAVQEARASRMETASAQEEIKRTERQIEKIRQDDRERIEKKRIAAVEQRARLLRRLIVIGLFLLSAVAIACLILSIANDVPWPITIVLLVFDGYGIVDCIFSPLNALFHWADHKALDYGDRQVEQDRQQYTSRWGSPY